MENIREHIINDTNINESATQSTPIDINTPDNKNLGNNIAPRTNNNISKLSSFMTKFEARTKAFSRRIAKAFTNLFNSCIAWVIVYAILHTCCSLNPQLTVDAPWLIELLEFMETVAQFAGNFLKKILDLFNMLIQEIFKEANANDPLARFFTEVFMFFFG